MRTILFTATLAIAAAALPVNAAPLPARVTPPLSTKDAARVLADLEQEYKKRIDALYADGTLPVAPNTPGNQLEHYEVNTIAEVVSGRFRKSRPERRQLAEAVALLGDEGFGYFALQEVICQLTYYGERELLVSLLARRCPPRMHSIQLDVLVLVLVQPSRLPDGTLILCDAYERSRDDAAKKTIYFALERAFRFLHIKSTSDDDYVVQVRKWYLENRGEYERSLGYLYHLRGPKFDFETDGALVVKGTNRRRGF